MSDKIVPTDAGAALVLEQVIDLFDDQIAVAFNVKSEQLKILSRPQNVMVAAEAAGKLYEASAVMRTLVLMRAQITGEEAP